ncbi:MAG: PQQ-binding-like beta-propeller repeat protein [Planctomyces sp.]|nr:PQQ-binding-like beta-propeller repeat protein [Planctomyces sp.]
MAFLEIIHLTGETEQRPLEKQQPVSIGSHASNDIQIDEDAVESMHCRVSWAKEAFEAVAAGVDGLEVNGAIVQRATLKPGDVLRFGTVDVRFRDDEAAAKAPRESEGGLSEISLKPLSEEVNVPEWLKGSASQPSKVPTAPAKPASRPAGDSAPRSAGSAAKGSPKSTAPSAQKTSSSSSKSPAPRSAGDKAPPGKASSSKPSAKAERPAERSPEPPKKPSREASPPARAEEPRRPAPEPPKAPAKKPVRELDLDAGLAALAAESRGSKAPSSSKPRRDEALDDLFEPPDDEAPDEPLDDRLERDSRDEVESSSAPAPAAAATSEDTVTDRIRRAMKEQHARPGEQDVARSPLVLGLAIGSLVLALAAAVFYFIGNRQSTQMAYDAANSLFEQQKYNEAIAELTKFLQLHAKSSLAPQARVQLGLARIDQQINGATPNFPEGFKLLKDFIAARRELPGFGELQQQLATRAGQVAEGAAKMAGRPPYARDLLAISQEAKGVFATNSPRDAQPTEELKRIDALGRDSEAAILKNETYESLLARIDEAIAGKQPLEALVLRRELLARYPDLERDRRVLAATQKMLETERELVQDDAFELEAIKDPLPTNPGTISLVYQARTRTDQVSVQRAIPVLAEDSLFGIDTITGAPVWKVTVGAERPFFPVRDAGTSSLIAFDNVRQEVLRIQQNSGQALWRQPVDSPASGRPLLDEGQVYVPTAGGVLYRFDLETGRATGRLRFSQEISNPVALDDGSRIVVGGDREVFYTITKRPLACVAVSYLGQPSKSIVAPLLSMGPYVLAAENRTTNTCRLRLLTTEPKDQPLRDIATADVAGQVVDPPAVRGRDLFVPSTGERVAAFLLSAEMGQPPLSTGPTYEVKGGQPTVTYLAPAPDEELFMASTALRKLQLTVDALQPAQEPILLGRASQPLQYQDRMMYVARKRRYSDAVVLTPVDRTSLSGDWQAIVGAEILAASPVSGDSPSVICATESGNLFRITARHLESGGFLSVAERLPLNEELADPLLARAIGDGQLMVACGLPDPRLWVVNRVGQIERSLILSQPLQAAPALLGNRILAPVAGALQLLQATNGQQAGQEFKLPGDIDAGARWSAAFAAGNDSGVAVLESGIVFSVRLQSNPRPHVAEAGRYALNAPLGGRPAFAEGRLAVASVDGQVAVIPSDVFEPRTRQLPAAVTAGPWLTGDMVLVEVGGTELHALSIAADLPELWVLPLDGTHVAGTPTPRGGTLMIPLQDGRIVDCDPGSGAIQSALELNVALNGEPVAVGTKLYVPAMDGSLVLVPEAQP